MPPLVSHTVMPVGSYGVNCVVFWNDAGQCALVDPGQDSDALLSFIDERRLTLEAVLLTHCHFDHIGALPGILARHPNLSVFAHFLDWKMFGHPLNQFPPEYPSVPRPDNLRDILELPSACIGMGFSVIETPGHTPGSVCLRSGDLLLSGDTLFAGSCGRTDFPGGNMAAMRRSLATLAKLPPETVVIPGHGAKTTIGEEVANNPFMER